MSRLQGLLIALLLGSAFGIGSYTFIYARGASYMTDDPAACMNCHVMREQYDGWIKASHRAVATCNDCHTPHGVVGKYWTKAQNGFWHSFAFTTGRFPEPIRITERNRAITEASCAKCHDAIVRQIDGHAQRGDGSSCLNCHRDVGHLH